MGVIDEIKEAMGERVFGSLEDAQAFVDDFTSRRNHSSIDDFDGLSPYDMSRMLMFPFDSPDVVEITSSLTVNPTGPAIALFGVLANAIGVDGLKPTATGNLPVKLVREAADAVMDASGRPDYALTGSLRSESNYPDLHALRLNAEIAKLVRRYKGRFILSSDARKVLAREGLSGIYPRLLRVYTTVFNWGYRDGYPEFPIIQQSFLFSLRLLSRYGDTWRPSTFYEDAFLKAFPQALTEAEQYRSYWTEPERTVRRCYSIRCLERFASFFGLAEIDLDPNDWLRGDLKIRKTPLLDHVVKFHVTEQNSDPSTFAKRTIT